MTFEWDSEKAASNLAKHGVSFDLAAHMDWSAALVATMTVRGEARAVALVPLGDRLHVCVYTDRGNARRIISLRKANRREVRRYLEG